MGRQVVFATKNAIKFELAQGFFTVDGKQPIELIPPNAPLLQRTGALERVVKEKAVYAYQAVERACMVMDSSLEIDALGGFPGIHITSTLRTLGMQRIVRYLEGQKRTCTFRVGVAYTDRGMYHQQHPGCKGGYNPEYRESSIDGKIAPMAHVLDVIRRNTGLKKLKFADIDEKAIRDSLRYDHWSQIYLIFMPRGEKRTLAEMPPDECKEWEKRLYQPCTDIARWIYINR
ncbi:hypothetical protein HY489_01575 [Candidatus Woesearchaeota archaeon]|nr:hypothetical protein [Candidatus Woesearchaeota archaeon]